MAYPTSITSFSSPTATDYLNSPSHTTQHTTLNTDVAGLETKIGIGASPASGATDGYVLMADGAGNSAWEELIVNRAFTWWFDGAVAANTTTRLYSRYIVPENMTIKKAWAVIETAPTGASLLVDIYINGTSIWAATPANRLTITASATSGNQTSFDTTAITAGNYLDIYIDQVGSTVAGSSLAVTLECSQP